MRSVLNVLLLFILFFSACRKDERITKDPGAKLSLLKDTLLFDTVFTSVGSVTQKIKLFNKNKDAVNISEVRLAGGNSSPFSLNINGQSITNKSNLILNGRDSLNLFIKATINPNAQSNPFLVQDSIVLSTNGNRQVIKLIAYGQNAVFINNASITTHSTWTKNLPYIINGFITIKNGVNLNIQPGAKIYFHKDAVMNVEGFLSANGTFNEPIQFSGDRLERLYTNEPGQWKGIYLKNTGSGIIKYTIIKNASVGITSDSLSTNSAPKLILSNTIIKNMQVAAYMGYHSELFAFNNLMYNCGNYLIYAVGGGNYNLKQNTFAGYNLNFPRKTAALTFSDYLSPTAYNKLQLNLTNNIIWGSLTNELDIQKKSSAIVQNNIFANLIKTSNTAYAGNGNLINTDPLFISSLLENFSLSASSPAIKKGIDLNTDIYFNAYLSRDLANKLRLFPSTIGCYEIN